MMFEALEQKTLVEQVEARIIDTIRKSNLEVGDSLPSEIELTESLGVSRTVVREALSRLRLMGLLASRKKRGMVLTEPDIFGGCSQILDAAFLNAKTQENLFEIRLMLEIGLADILFLRKNDKGLAMLRNIVEKLKNVTSEKARVRLDVEFHSTLYQIAGNDLLHRFQSLLQPFFEIAAVNEKKSKRRQGSVTHADLLKELESGTPESFRQAMREHLGPHFESLRKG